MNWNTEMTRAYEVGVMDGKTGVRRGRPNDFEACYEQGWQHGKRQQVVNILHVWDQARKLMREAL